MCPPFTLSPQNHESQLQVNHLSPFLLALLLLPLLLSTAAQSPPHTVRIINVSSDGASKLAPKEGILFDDMNAQSKSTWTRYGMSKLAGVLFARELARRYRNRGVVALALHPGTVKTYLPLQPPFTNTTY
jgi:NAD(P)-dependent dehydrogenase (short-subunit alcohol dehydrogenase family)